MEQQAPFKIRPFADVGTSEAFFARISGLLDLLGATDLQQEEARRTKEAIILICFEGLFPAFSHLRQIRKQPEDLPELNRRQPYDDFTRALWHSYKDLAQGAIRELGFDIGFLFKSQDAFEQVLSASKRPIQKLAQYSTLSLEGNVKDGKISSRMLGTTIWSIARWTSNVSEAFTIPSRLKSSSSPSGQRSKKYSSFLFVPGYHPT